MDLLNKYVWDLSLDEIEYVYKNRHMNHYVYAGLKTYYTSSPPLHRPVSLRTDMVPGYLCSAVEKLLILSPFVGKKDPAVLRTGITYLFYQLYHGLENVSLQDISTIVQLLAACAYLLLHSEKNDNMLLWNGPVVRNMTKYSRMVVKRLLMPTVDIEAICSLEPFSPTMAKRKRKNELPAHENDIPILYQFMPKAMRSLIAYMENGKSPEMIEQALLNTEQAMVHYENNHTVSLPPLYSEKKKLRYHNTLYLYGAMFFQRQGLYNRAVDWYLKHIDVYGLPYLFGNFLTDLKTTERLVSAFPLINDKKKQSDLMNLIQRCMVTICHNISKHSQRVNAYYESHPTTDMRAVWLKNGKGKVKDTDILYAGEAAREILLFSLLYNKFVRGVDYKDIDYASFLMY